MVVIVDRARRFLCALVLLALATGAQAAVYRGLEGPVRQPDGTVISTRLYGDEFVAWLEHDGFTIVKERLSGAWCYAIRQGDMLAPGPIVAGKGDPRTLRVTPHLRPGRSVSAGQAKARRQAWGVRVGETGWGYRAPRSQVAQKGTAPPSAPPSHTTTGLVNGLVINVEFTDVAGDAALLAETEPFCNSDNYTGNGNTGSVKKYYYDVSNTKLTFTNNVGSRKYVKVPHAKDYYNQTGGVWRDAGESGVELLNDVFTILNGLTDAQRLADYGIDYSTLSVDGAGLVPAVSIFYTGDRPSNDHWAEGLWPHMMPAGAVSIPLTGNGAGKTISTHQITDMGDALTIGTFAHECGHMVCEFPDLYDYGDVTGGVGDYCLMDGGSYNNGGRTPARVSGYLRYRAGWIDAAETIDLGALGFLGWGMKGATTTNIFLYGKDPTSSSPKAMGSGVTEYFLIEGRPKTGWDAYLPDDGLAVWHIDETSSNSTNDLAYKGHNEVNLTQADNLDHLGRRINGGDDQDLYPATSPSNNECRFTTSPSSAWWDGTDSGMILSDIQASAPSQAFRFGSATPVFITQPATTYARVGNTVAFSVSVVSDPAATLAWERSPNGLAWSPIAGEVGTSYQFTMTDADVNAWFHCIATNTAGSATSDPAQLKLSPSPAVNNTVVAVPGGAVGRDVPPSIGSLEGSKKSCGLGSGLGLVALALMVGFTLRRRRQS